MERAAGRERREGVAQGWREADVQLDHVEMGDAGREILGENTKAAADLEHDVGRVQFRGTTDHPEDVRVDKEVLAQRAARSH
jgi:hypothetical protein